MKRKNTYKILISGIILTVSAFLYIVIQFRNYIEGVVIVIPEGSKGNFEVIFGCKEKTKGLEIKDNLGILFIDKTNNSIQVSNNIDLNTGILLLEMDYDKLNELEVDENAIDIKSKVSEYSFRSLFGDDKCGETILSFHLD